METNNNLTKARKTNSQVQVPSSTSKNAATGVTQAPTIKTNSQSILIPSSSQSTISGTNTITVGKTISDGAPAPVASLKKAQPKVYKSNQGATTQTKSDSNKNVFNFQSNNSHAPGNTQKSSKFNNHMSAAGVGGSSTQARSSQDFFLHLKPQSLVGIVTFGYNEQLDAELSLRDQYWAKKDHFTKGGTTQRFADNTKKSSSTQQLPNYLDNIKQILYPIGQTIKDPVLTLSVKNAKLKEIMSKQNKTIPFELPGNRPEEHTISKEKSKASFLDPSVQKFTRKSQSRERISSTKIQTSPQSTMSSSNIISQNLQTTSTTQKCLSPLADRRHSAHPFSQMHKKESDPSTFGNKVKDMSQHIDSFESLDLKEIVHYTITTGMDEKKYLSALVVNEPTFLWETYDKQTQSVRAMIRPFAIVLISSQPDFQSAFGSKILEQIYETTYLPYYKLLTQQPLEKMQVKRKPTSIMTTAAMIPTSPNRTAKKSLKDTQQIQQQQLIVIMPNTPNDQSQQDKQANQENQQFQSVKLEMHLTLLFDFFNLIQDNSNDQKRAIIHQNDKNQTSPEKATSISKQPSLSIAHNMILNQSCFYKANFSFTLLWKSISTINLIKLIQSLILERKIILVSKNQNQMAIIIESLLQLIQPLDKSVFVQVPYILNYDMLMLLDTPRPFVIGIRDTLWQSENVNDEDGDGFDQKTPKATPYSPNQVNVKALWEQNFDETLIAFDIDTGEWFEKTEHPQFPKEATDLLQNSLDQLEFNFTDDDELDLHLKIKQAFFNYLLLILEVVPNFLLNSTNDDDPFFNNEQSNTKKPKTDNALDLFQMEDFMDIQEKEFVDFYEQFMQTQLFHDFLNRYYQLKLANENTHTDDYKGLNHQKHDHSRQDDCQLQSSLEHFAIVQHILTVKSFDQVLLIQLHLIQELIRLLKPKDLYKQTQHTCYKFDLAQAAYDQALSKLNHPNVKQSHQKGADNQASCIIDWQLDSTSVVNTNMFKINPTHIFANFQSKLHTQYLAHLAAKTTKQHAEQMMQSNATLSSTISQSSSVNFNNQNRQKTLIAGRKSAQVNQQFKKLNTQKSQVDEQTSKDNNNNSGPYNNKMATSARLSCTQMLQQENVRASQKSPQPSVDSANIVSPRSKLMIKVDLRNSPTSSSNYTGEVGTITTNDQNSCASTSQQAQVNTTEKIKSTTSARNAAHMQDNNVFKKQQTSITEMIFGFMSRKKTSRSSDTKKEPIIVPEKEENVIECIDLTDHNNIRKSNPMTMMESNQRLGEKVTTLCSMVRIKDLVIAKGLNHNSIKVPFSNNFDIGSSPSPLRYQSNERKFNNTQTAYHKQNSSRATPSNLIISSDNTFLQGSKNFKVFGPKTSKATCKRTNKLTSGSITQKKLNDYPVPTSVQKSQRNNVLAQAQKSSKGTKPLNTGNQQKIDDLITTATIEKEIVLPLTTKSIQAKKMASLAEKNNKNLNKLQSSEYYQSQPSSVNQMAQSHHQTKVPLQKQDSTGEYTGCTNALQLKPSAFSSSAQKPKTYKQQMSTNSINNMAGVKKSKINLERQKQMSQLTITTPSSQKSLTGFSSTDINLRAHADSSEAVYSSNSPSNANKPQQTNLI